MIGPHLCEVVPTKINILEKPWSCLGQGPNVQQILHGARQVGDGDERIRWHRPQPHLSTPIPCSRNGRCIVPNELHAMRCKGMGTWKTIQRRRGTGEKRSIVYVRVQLRFDFERWCCSRRNSPTRPTRIVTSEPTPMWRN